MPKNLTKNTFHDFVLAMAILAFRRPRVLAALGLLACTALSLLPLGCSSKIEYPSLHGPHPSADPQVPIGTAERLRDCLSEHGGELPGRDYTFRFDLQVDQEGRVLNSVDHDIPVRDGDLAACMKTALRAMDVPKWVLDIRPATPPDSGKERALIGNAPAILILITMGEIIIEAGGITVVFAIALERVTTAVKEGVDAARRKKKELDDCQRELNACLETDLNDEFGSVKGSQRCKMCYQECKNVGYWPWRLPIDDDEYISCEYKKPQWQR